MSDLQPSIPEPVVNEAIEAELAEAPRRGPGRPRSTPVEKVSTPDPLDPLPVVQDDTTKLLADLGMVIKEAIANSNDSSRVNAAVDALAKLNAKDFPSLAEHPVITKFLETVQKAQVKQGGLRPGEVINKGTLAENVIPWTLGDMKGLRDWDGKTPLPPGYVEWVFNVVPESSRPVIVNGVKVQFYRRVPYSGPKVFWDVYMDSLNAEEAAAQHAAFMMKAKGAGVPNDPTILGPASMGVRASFTEGSYQPGMGTQGMAPTPSAEPAEADNPVVGAAAS